MSLPDACARDERHASPRRQRSRTRKRIPGHGHDRRAPSRSRRPSRPRPLGRRPHLGRRWAQCRGDPGRTLHQTPGAAFCISPKGPVSGQRREGHAQGHHEPCPEELWRSITWDQGAEMSDRLARITTSRPASRFTSAIPMPLGSVDRTKTPTGSCASTYPRAPTSRSSPPPTYAASSEASTVDPAKDPRLSDTIGEIHRASLRPPVESAHLHHRAIWTCPPVLTMFRLMPTQVTFGRDARLGQELCRIHSGSKHGRNPGPDPVDDESSARLPHRSQESRLARERRASQALVQRATLTSWSSTPEERWCSRCRSWSS